MSACAGKRGSGARTQAGANTCLSVPQGVNVCLCDTVLEDSNHAASTKLHVHMHAHGSSVRLGCDWS